MKKTLLLAICSILLFSCNQRSSTGEELLKILNEKDVSLVVSNNDSISDYSGRRVDDLMSLLNDEPERLKGAIVADKMVGHAAAMLLICGGVKEVHTNYATTDAIKLLKKAGIKTYYAQEGEMIFNRDRTGQCPMDASLNGITDPQKGFEILKNKFYND